MRARCFQHDLTESLRGADDVWIGPIHRPERIPESDRLDRAELAAALSSRGLPARFSDDVDAIVEQLAKTNEDGDVVLILSNGAFGGIYEKLRHACGVEVRSQETGEGACHGA